MESILGKIRKAAARFLGRGLLVSIALAAPLAPLPSWAQDADPSNDLDTLTLTLSPLVDLGVDVDTSAVSTSFALAMGATAYTVTPTTVTLLGNIQPQELDLSASVWSSGGAWSLDADEDADPDQIQVYALFSVQRSSQPLESEFGGTKNLLTTGAKRAGTSEGAGSDGNFENDSMTGAADMDDIMLSSPERQLWLRLDTPPKSGTDSDQKITVTITATRSGM